MKLFGSWRKEEASAEQSPFKAADTNAAPTPAAAVQDPIGKGRKILIVDDNSVVLKAFELKFKASGFVVMTASEGAEAVSSARQFRPDVIVLDINFPPDVGSSGLQWDGFTIMQWLQRFDEVGKIPVIIVSSNDATKFKQKALDAGAVAYLQKPVNYEEFMEVVRCAFGHANGKGVTSNSVPPSVST